MLAQSSATVLRDEHESERRAMELLLLDGVLRGDAESEAAFVERFVPLIRHCLRALSHGCLSEPDLDDLVGEVWLRLWENDKHRLRCFDPSRGVRVSTWIATLARRCSIDQLRSLRRAPLAGVDEEPPDQRPLAQEALEQRERDQLVRQALAGLTPDEREFLQALCVEELGALTLAARLGVALPTIYSRRFKITAKLARNVRRLTAPSGPRRAA
jgi:RNA polymerase sigma-70 factor, ECF subfamily